MYGGAGNDAYFLDNIGDVVVENANEGSDTVYATANYRLGANVEYLVLLGGAVQGYGNALSNAIYGTGADNLLDGDAGANSMYGGAGNDAYFLDNIGDVVVENANEGSSDTVYATANYRLGANVENLVLLGHLPCRATATPCRTRSTAPARTTCSTAIAASTRCMAWPATTPTSSTTPAIS